MSTDLRMLLLKWQDGSLTEKEEELLLRELSGSPENRRMLVEEITTYSAVIESSEATVQAAAAKRKPVRKRRLFRPIMAWAAAATLCAAVLIWEPWQPDQALAYTAQANDAVLIREGQASVLKQGDPLYPGDHIRTGEAPADLLLSFSGPELALRVHADTQILLRDYTNQSLVELTAGRINMDAENLRGYPVHMSMPGMRTRIEGTAYSMSYRDAVPTVAVREGTVTVLNEAGEQHIARAGESIRIEEGMFHTGQLTLIEQASGRDLFREDFESSNEQIAERIALDGPYDSWKIVNPGRDRNFTVDFISDSPPAVVRPQDPHLLKWTDYVLYTEFKTYSAAQPYVELRLVESDAAALRLILQTDPETDTHTLQWILEEAAGAQTVLSSIPLPDIKDETWYVFEGCLDSDRKQLTGRLMELTNRSAFHEVYAALPVAAPRRGEAAVCFKQVGCIDDIEIRKIK